MSRIDDIEANLHTAVVSMNSRQPAADIQDRNIARTLVDDGTDLVTFVREMERLILQWDNAVDSNVRQSLGTAGIDSLVPSAFADGLRPAVAQARDALDRLNGGA